MLNSFSSLNALFGRHDTRHAHTAPPVVGDVYYRRPEHGPVEYAQVIGVYEEAAGIFHVRFQLHYGYQDKTEALGERTLAAALFAKRFTRKLETAGSAE